MEWIRRLWLSSSSYVRMLFLSLLLLPGLSASTFVSDDIFVPQASIGRNLLQEKKACPISFEFKNYSIITSQCRAPEYPPQSCCAAFKEFACPYVDDLNDSSNNCASNMFIYINLYGKYPNSLFADLCREGKDGLACPASPPMVLSTDSNDSGGGGDNALPIAIAFISLTSIVIALLVNA